MERKYLKNNYIVTDFQRVFKRYAWIIAVIGVILSRFFALDRMGIDENVLFLYRFSTDMPGFILCFVFCGFVYGASYAEDLENKYIRYCIMRGNLKKYIFSKTVMIYITAFLVMVAGTFIFTVICSTKVPWINAFGDIDYFRTVNYGSFVVSGKYYMYILLSSMHMGMAAGMLSNIAAVISIFIKNKVLAYAMPAILYVVFIGEITEYFNSEFAFYTENSGVNFLIVFFISVIITFTAAVIANVVLKRKL